MPIRWRLTLWFSLILCIAIVLSGAVIHTLLQRSLGNEVDDNLRVSSARVHGTLKPEQIPEPLDYEVIHDSLPPVNEFASPGIYIQLIDRDGNIVVKSDNLGPQQLPVDPSLVERGFAGDVAIKTLAAGEGARVRVMLSPLFLQSEVLVLEVAQSLKHVDATMSQVRWALMGGILAALALAIASGGIVVRKALAPVASITKTAQRIGSSSDLTQRVGYQGPADEIGELATTFDHMIERLDTVFESQKHFIGDASHDLRTPLTVLRGNLDLLKRDLGEEDRREALRAMESETHRMTKTVDDLLLLAEVESGQTERRDTVSLREILLEGLERGQQLAGNRKLSAGPQEDICVTGDTHRLKRLLGNLIDNAIKYTPEEGTITLSLYTHDGWARLDVTDSGIGIPREHLAHLFERFYKVDKGRSRSSKGSGLGLAIVKAIAEQHRGKVTVASEPGKGSTFSVWLRI
ncbi:MAG: ATP-binding protein [Dehalococcoidia bacterium]